MEFSNDFNTIFGENIMLKIIDKNQGNKEELPYYYYDIYLADGVTQIGKISIRIGHNYHSYFNGNVGYEIDKEFRGNNFAYEATKIVVDVAKHHQITYLILTCEESNIASYKSIEKLGAKLIETKIPPKDYIFYNKQMKAHRIYRLSIWLKLLKLNLKICQAI